ncbi:MAG: tail fiber domain-containing protein, partial [Chloroflexota bacterium]
AASGDAQVGVDSVVNGVVVTEGYFTAVLNTTGQFGGGAFNGEARWLEVAVRCPAGGGEYTTLTPRQPLDAAPLANYALRAPWNGLSGVPAGFADGVDNDTTYSAGTGLLLSHAQFSLPASYRLPQSCANDQIARWNGSAWNCANDNDTTTFWSLTGNDGTTPGTNFIGTTNNQALVFKVNGLRALRLEPNATSPNVIGGYSGNSVAAGVVGATIGGGGQNDYGYINQVTGNYGTVGGGIDNEASGTAATVGGGVGNEASDYSATVGGGATNTASGSSATVGGGGGNEASGYSATVGGGATNTASGSSATVGGGVGNEASGYSATVGGGLNNAASGHSATVGGGGNNTAAGDYSFVAGRRASNDNANHDGVFLFADWNDSDFLSTAANEFAVRASGGVRLRTSSTLTTGCNLAAGSGTWDCTSDRDAKANFAAVDGRAILAQVAALPITTWNFKTQDASIQHIGPVAQDFYAAFGTGESDTTISMVDADGVALAAIQGLNEIVQEKEAQIAALEARLTALEQGTAPNPVTSLLTAPWPWLALCLIVLGGMALWRRKEGGV